LPISILFQGLENQYFFNTAYPEHSILDEQRKWICTRSSRSNQAFTSWKNQSSFVWFVV